MKFRKFLFTGSLSLFALAACVSNDDKSEWNDGSQPINFTSSIQGLHTRAANAEWTAGDKVGVFMKTADGDLSAAMAVNKLHTTDKDGNLTASDADNALYYPTDGSSVDFVAYYPYVASLTGTTYKADVATQTDQPAIDLLYSNNAKGFSKGASSQPQLQFAHMLSQIVLNIEKDATIPTLNGLKVTFKGMNTKADFALADGSLSNAGTVADIAANVAANGATATTIVLPAATLSNIKVVFDLDGKSYTADYPQTVLEAGRKYVHKVDMSNSNGQPVIVMEAATITDWTEVPGDDMDVDFGGGVTPPDPTPSDNLVQNPGFEDWTGELAASWDNSYNTPKASITKSTDIKHSGNNALKQVSASSTSKIQQEVAITGGKTYRISYWFLDNDAKASTRMWSSWVNGSTTLADDKAQLQQETYSKENAEWKQTILILKAPATADKFRFEVRTYKQSGSDFGGFIYYDDFEIVEVTQ